MLKKDPAEKLVNALWPKWVWADLAKQKTAQTGFVPSRATERSYERQLKSVAARIKTIIQTGATAKSIEKDLQAYAQVLEPWAKQSAANMMAGINRKNVQTWQSIATRMGLDMRVLLHSPGIGQTVQNCIAENARLIENLPLEAAEKIARITAENLVVGSRADDVAKRIAKVGEMTFARARTIARTEASKANTALSQARAISVGSSGYIWRTARDGDVRPSHKAMEGKFVAWDSPPTLDGMKGHAGEFPNDRCYAEPLVPKDGGGVYKTALPTQGQERNVGEQQRLSTWEKEISNPVVKHVPGTPLVNVDRATADKQGKFINYALTTDSSKNGYSKAKVFKSALGAGPEHADMLYKQMMNLLPYAEAKDHIVDEHGVRFNVFMPLTGPNGKTIDVTTAWIYDNTGKNKINTSPRLITLFIPEDSHAF